jgi:hypothetical protein
MEDPAMVKLRTGSLLAVSVALLVAAGGCGSDEPTSPGAASPPGDDFQAMDFDAPFGGLTATDEAVAFGDRDLLAAEIEIAGEVYLDPLADDPLVRELLAAGEGPGDPGDPLRPRFTFLRILWGALELEGSDPEAAGRTDDGEEIDWSGVLRVDRGIVLVRRVISFERPEDHVVRPRTDRHTVAWHSRAGDDFDGLLIQIIEPPHPGPGERPSDEPLPPPPPNQLHFRSGPFTQSFPVDDLAGLDSVFEVEAPGQAIRFTGFTLGSLNPCPKGFLTGRWVLDPEAEPAGGWFRGVWIGIEGRVFGHMRGRWGFNEAGDRVFFGKTIDRRGACLGLVAGAWAPGERPGRGWFRGRWFDPEREPVGVLDGIITRRPERPVGSFQGRWAAFCDEEAAGQVEGT